MATITLTDTELEVFGMAVMMEFGQRDIIPTEWHLMMGQIDGEVVNQTIYNAGEATILEDGNDHNGSAEITGIEVPLVNPIKDFVDIKFQSIDERPGLQLLQNSGKMIGRNIGFQHSLMKLNLLAKESDTLANTVSGDLDATVTATLATAAKSVLLEIIGNMDDDSVPNGDRYAVVKPQIFHALHSADDVVRLDFGGPANVQNVAGNFGTMLRWHDVIIVSAGGFFAVDWTAAAHSGRNLPSTMAFDMTNVYGLVWHKEAWVERIQRDLLMTVEWIPRSQVWMPIGRLHMGAKVLTANASAGELQGTGLYAMINA